LSGNIRGKILEALPLRQLRIVAKKEGMRTLLDAAWDLAVSGETTLEEVARIADLTDPGREDPTDL
jgi:type II secretory ATPase GspE/PulE/Tfp pilus assembly ATPase PilB-like protein